MHNHSERGTFVTLREILDEAARRCMEELADLNSFANRADHPYALAWREMAQYEHDLAVLLQNFSSGAPEKLLQTRFQYSPDATEPVKSVSAEEAVARLADSNHELTENLAELSNNIAPPDLGAMLDELRRQVEALGQKISMISVTMLDN